MGGLCCANTIQSKPTLDVPEPSINEISKIDRNIEADNSGLIGMLSPSKNSNRNSDVVYHVKYVGRSRNSSVNN